MSMLTCSVNPSQLYLPESSTIGLLSKHHVYDGFVNLLILNPWPMKHMELTKAHFFGTSTGWGWGGKYTTIEVNH